MSKVNTVKKLKERDYFSVRYDSEFAVRPTHSLTQLIQHNISTHRHVCKFPIYISLNAVRRFNCWTQTRIRTRSQTHAILLEKSQYRIQHLRSLITLRLCLRCVFYMYVQYTAFLTNAILFRFETKYFQKHIWSKLYLKKCMYNIIITSLHGVEH